MTAPVVRAARPVALVDLAVVALLAAASLAGLVHVYGGLWFAPAAAAGVLTGTGLAWAGARWRWSILTVAVLTVVAYLLVGGPFAYRETTIAGVVPGLSTVRELLLGAVRAWKGFVTAPTPVTAFPELVVVPLLAGLLATVLATSLALRLSRPAWALLPLSALLVGTILLSSAQASWPVVQGGVFAVVSVAWLAWRRAGQAYLGRHTTREGLEERDDVGRLRRRRLIGAAAMVAVVAGAVFVTGPVVAGADARYVLRDQMEPPLDLRLYASPLESFRRYVKDAEEDVLFTVDGLPESARLRLAVLDTYTGTVMDVAGGDRSGPGSSGSFELAGTAFHSPVRSSGTATEVTVTVGEYSGVWVPSPALPSAVAFGGDRVEDLDSRLYVNDETGTMVDAAGLGQGDSYVVTAVVPEATTLDDLSAEEPVQDASTGQYRVEATAQVARTVVGGETDPLTQIRLIRDELTANGVFSDGLDGELPSPAGHGAGRILRLLGQERWVGDDEQFAVAAALMIRTLGYSSRVVMGFYPDAATAPGSGQVDLRGTDVHAWVEVAIQGEGWVPLDVTPDEDNVPQDQDPRSNREPQPVVIEDPPPPEEPALANQPPLAQEDVSQDEDEGIDLGAYLRIVALVGFPVLILVGPFVGVAAAKARRRRRRRTAAHPVGRVSGGWREVADTAVDLGARVTPGATRRETAAGLHLEYGGTRMLAVADRADQVVFGPGEPTDEEIRDFWAEVDGLVAELRGGAGPWRWIRSRVSLRSLGVRRSVSGLGRRTTARLARGGRR